jgi:hypothetical protein
VPHRKGDNSILIALLSIPTISAAIGLILLTICLFFAWKHKGNLGFPELLEIAAYSFIASIALGAFLSSTWYVFTGAVFPGETLGSLDITIEIGAVVVLLGGFFAYYKHMKSFLTEKENQE